MDRPPQFTALVARMPAGEALRLICRLQLEAIERHRPGARLGRDARELHDLRVAVRRTRSALGEFREYFPLPAVARFRTEFRWLGEITGPVRDLDVYLETLPDYQRLLSGEVAAALEPFRTFLQRHRRTEQRRLVRRLTSLRLQHLIDDWRGLLMTGGTDPWPEIACQPAAEVARRRIWKLYRRFLRQGKAITTDAPDAELHRLRITGKKLRYLIEFFRELYPPGEIDELVKTMKSIQDYLGDYQDCAVQQAHLSEMDRQMASEGAMPPETHAALALLVQRLRRRQLRLRKEFPARFRVFAHGRGRRSFVRLYAPAERGS